MIENIPRHLFGPQDNIGKELYVPCLKKCTKFRRATGFFQPSVLRRWAPALKDIVDNNTKIEILMGVSENAGDIRKHLEEASDLSSRQNILQYELDKTLKNIKDFNSGDKSNKKLFQIMRYLIANNQLEIKFSVAVREDGTVSLAHEKIGYFHFEDSGEVVLFHGSANESDTALLSGGEQVTICKSTKPNDHEDINKWKTLVDDIWDEKYDYRLVLGPDHEIIQKITSENVEITKDEIKEIIQEYLEEIKVDTCEDKASGNKLRPYQSRAIDAWFKNNHKGIIAHATGTGKTFTSLKLIEKLINDKDMQVVIGVPYVFLADQWVSILNKHFREMDTHEFNGVVECYDSETKWKQKGMTESFQFKRKLNEGSPNKVKHLSIYVVVNKTLSSPSFSKFFSSFIGGKNTLFIGDECHKYTSKVYFESLPDTKYRLGLSATPFVNETILKEYEKKMSDWFEGIIDTFTLEEAIGTYLCHYEYHPQICNMNQEEFSNWFSTIRQLKIDERILNDGFLDEDSSEFQKLSHVVSNCEEKFNKFSELINKLPNLKNTVIFCGERKLKNGEREVEHVGNLLVEKDVPSAKITAEVPRGDRESFIKNFTEGLIDTLNAIKVLDEGIDIPSIETAILLASSANRRQFVQRRGRVLRKSDDENKVAKIYDFIILPAPYRGTSGKAVVQRELERMAEMSIGANNEEAIKEEIASISKAFENYESEI